MKADEVIWLYRALEKQGITIWLDGGWAVDAVLEQQTRPHDDVDIVIQEKDVKEMRAWLESRGYSDVPRDDTSAWNFVLGDQAGHLIDVHVIVFDEAGNGVYGPAENGDIYPAEALIKDGGIIAGQPVHCLSAECLVDFHTGYPLREHDFHDVHALCKKFNIPLPAEYRSKPDKENSETA